MERNAHLSKTQTNDENTLYHESILKPGMTEDYKSSRPAKANIKKAFEKTGAALSLLKHKVIKLIKTAPFSLFLILLNSISVYKFL